ncbi:MAG: hypothetical protein MHM6MM_008268 [Cercozoa sp. M6MM]
MESYKIREQLGEGGQGKVLRAEVTSSARISAFIGGPSTTETAEELEDIEKYKEVAIKRINVKIGGGNGIDREAIRELQHMRELSHKHVMPLLDAFVFESALHVVMPIAHGDLQQVTRNVSRYPQLQASILKAWMLQLLQAINHCHQRYVLHRDIKPSNVLLSAHTGEVLLADFGLAREYATGERHRGKMSPQACTLWYRAPELLFGARSYGPAADMWSVGAVLGEMILRQPIFPGKSELDQLTRIFSVVGTPTPDTWPNATELPQFLEFESNEGTDLRALFAAAEPTAVDLFRRLCCLCPSRRLTAAQALQHPYFHSGSEAASRATVMRLLYPDMP